MTRMRWIALAVGAALALQGCLIPRAVGGVVKGVAKGTVKVVEGVTDVVTSPLE